MAIHTMTTARIARLNTISRSKGIDFEDLLKKEYNVDEVIVSEMGGVWLGGEYTGKMLTADELAELGQKLSEKIEQV